MEPSAYVTLSQATKLVEGSKTSIQRAIKTGKLPIKGQDKGGYKIDMADLFNHFKPKKQNNDTGTSEHNGTEKDALEQALKLNALELELKHSRELLRKEEENHAETKAEKARLLAALENQTRLLVHMKEETANKPPETPVERRRGFWDALLRKPS